jgi:hypothetical protein
MSDSTAYTIGSEVACIDGACGELRRVVIDPVARALTHLVVEERHRVGNGRLVPIELVESSAAGEIRLRCTAAEFDTLDDAEDTQFFPGAPGDWGYNLGQMMSLPYFGLGIGMGGMGLGGAGMGGVNSGPQSIINDRVPVGEVELRRGDSVAASDGNIGKVQGLVIDRSDHHGAVKEVNAASGVHVNLTKDQVRDLPPVQLDETQ